MDRQRFDEMARLMGAGASRRRVLRAFGGGLLGLAGGFAIRPTSAIVVICAPEGDQCTTDSDCCEGLFCPPDQMDCTVIQKGGSATVTIHKATCPSGVAPADIFDACHANGLGGVSFAIDGFEVGSGTIVTDADGVASATVLEAAKTGDITVTEDPAVFGDYLGSYVYCAEQVSGTVLFDGSAAGGTVTFTASQGDEVVCDWYNITAGDDEPSDGVTELPSTGAGTGPADAAWIGAAALGAAALLAARKLQADRATSE